MSQPGTISVFIADDHAIIREGLAALLVAQPDIRIAGTAGNGREALAGVLQAKPAVVILDIAMPEMNGIEAARQIHAALPQARIVILSMHAGAEHVFQALEAGARGYLLKESAAKEIVDAVRTVQLGRRYLSAKVAEVLADRVGRRTAVSPLESLSARERQILKLVADGLSSVRIAEMLHLSPKTVDTYRSRLMEKLNLSDIASLVKFAIQHGLTSLD
ncbi:MAG TPA: response regulator transcription factor [Burkholderiales bacterium]|nr:response regulator transcription factor [Burkholderiales bacterium]